ncbi:hypothetical protein BO221_06690 [Archangium sp. Cb G35]|nr:hypothetical protein BO221_06690 [Archangium sp. Cb G35]
MNWAHLHGETTRRQQPCLPCREGTGGMLSTGLQKSHFRSDGRPAVIEEQSLHGLGHQLHIARQGTIKMMVSASGSLDVIRD